jgi:hypothetical protein
MPSELIDQPADSRVSSELSRAVSLMQPPLVRAPFDATVRLTQRSTKGGAWFDCGTGERVRRVSRDGHGYPVVSGYSAEAVLRTRA